jgi:outer membrane protein, heavy metal efflux system
MRRLLRAHLFAFATSVTAIGLTPIVLAMPPSHERSISPSYSASAPPVQASADTELFRLPPIEDLAQAQADLPRPLPTQPVPPSARGELLPGVGEVFTPPPNVPATPQGMQALEAASEATVETPAINLETLEEMACANNPTLIQAKAQVQGTLGMAIEAGLWPNPVFRYIQEQIGVENTPGEFVGGAVQQEIPTAHKRQLSRAKFLARTKVSEWIALGQEWQVLNDVRMHYFRTVGRQEIVAIQREMLKNAEDAALTARELYNLGRATRADVHLANVSLQQQRLQLLLAENRLRHSWQDLTAFVGVDLPFRPIGGSLEVPMQPIEWESALDRLLAEAPQLQEARAKLDGDRLQLERELVEPVPNIVVQAGAGQNFEANQGVGMLQIAMEVPLWDKNQGTIRQARADLARQHAEIRRIELLLRRQLAEVYERYVTAAQHVANFEQVILPEARRAYEIRLDSYKADRIQWTDVLVAERGYFALRIQYVEQLTELRETEVLIVGYLLHGGLSAPERPTPPGHIDASPRPR